MRKFFAALLFMLLITSPVYSQVVHGDVIVVLRNSSGFRINAAAVGGVKSLSAVQSFAQAHHVNVVQTFDHLSDAGDKIFMLVHSDTEDENTLLRKIKANPEVIAASLNRVHHLCADEAENIPNDPEYPNLWGMDAIHAPQAWTRGTGSDDVYVAVVDTGIDYNHPDLKDNFSHEYSRNFRGLNSAGYDPDAYYDEQGHGTHVAGTIAGVGNNALGVAGVNWRAKLISLRIFGATGSATEADITAAFNYLAGLLAKEPDLKIAAVNYSVGGYASITPEENISGNNPMWLVFKILSDTNRIVICVAAGNEEDNIGRPTPSTTDNWNKGSYEQPCSFLGIDNMIAVAAATSGLNRAWFSNYSSKYVDITAPGTNILSTIPLTVSNDTGYAELPNIYPYSIKNGTSMATPHVTGAATLLKAMYPSATAGQIKAALLGGANGDYLREDGTSAYGMLDLAGAIKFMDGIMSEASAPKISDANVTNGVVNQRYKAELYASGTQPIDWEIDGELPEGLTFEGGKITGTPTESGTFPFVVSAVNDYGESSLALSLTISEMCIRDSYRPDEWYDMPDAYVGSVYKADILTTSGDWPMYWSISGGDYPEDFGVDINSPLGILTFKPTRAGTFSFPVTVSNDASSDSYTFRITVKDSKPAEILDITSHDMVLGRPVAMTYDSDDKFSRRRITVVASGTRPLSWDVKALPKGVDFSVERDKLNPLEETLSLTGRPEESGDFAVTVTVSNEWGSVSVDLNITVEDKAPVFRKASRTLDTLERDTEFTYTVPVDGSAPITFTTNGSLPEGTYMRYEDNTPIFCGKPTQTGHYTFTLIAENSRGRDESEFDLNVIEPSAITTNILPDAIKGVSYDAVISLRSDVKMSWDVFTDESLNMKISQTGEITGFPTEEGQFIVAVRAASPDVKLDIAKAYTLMVRAAPAIQTANIPDGRQNTPYTTTALSADGTAPITWTVSEGNLPVGLTLAQNGYILGTPSESGVFVFELTASNKSGQDSKIFTLSIESDGTVESDDEPVKSDDKPVSPDKPAVIVKQGSERGVSSLTVGELSQIAEQNAMIAAILPEVSVNVSDMYTAETVGAFANVKVSPDVPVGYALVWNGFVREESGAAEGDAVFYGSDGVETDTVPANRTVNISAYLEAGKTYAPVISAVRSGDVRSVGSSGGGCDAGVPVLGLGLMLCAVIFRKNSH